MNAMHIETAIRRHLNGAILIPEASVRYSCGMHQPNYGPAREYFSDYFADLMMISDAGYATELEVKVSRGDWKADLAKAKWESRFPAWISRFIYVVPIELGIPEWVPAQAGVWHVKAHDVGYPSMKVARAPKRMGAEKIPQTVRDRWMTSMYYRYWQMRAIRYSRVSRSLPATKPAQPEAPDVTTA